MTMRQEPWWWTSYFCVSSGVFQEKSAVFLQYSWIQCMEGEPAKPQILENKILQRFVTNPCVVVKRTSKQHIMHMAIVIVIVSILFCCNLYHLFFFFCGYCPSRFGNQHIAGSQGVLLWYAETSYPIQVLRTWRRWSYHPCKMLAICVDHSLANLYLIWTL